MRRVKLNAQLRPLLFPSNSWELSPDAKLALEANVSLLAGIPLVRATVEGHADDDGPEGYNEWLGLWRAKSVKDALRERGLSPAHFSLVTHGESRPNAPGDSEDARVRNRRVEIIVQRLE